MAGNRYSVAVLPKANRDLDNIYRYYYEESGDIAVADKVTGEIEAAIFRCHAPKLWPWVAAPCRRHESVAASPRSKISYPCAENLGLEYVVLRQL